MRNRFFSLAIPWFSDGALALLGTGMPLLAVRFGASSLLLGTMGWLGQVFRLPITLVSGNLSEKTGRTAIMLPALGLIVFSCISMGFVKSSLGILVFYTLAIAAYGAFYPPLQALIGDVSSDARLRKNLGAFNIGWCVGGAVAAIIARWLVQVSLQVTFFAAAAGAVIAGILVLIWQRRTFVPPDPIDSIAAAKPAVAAVDFDPARDCHGPLLIIARMGHVLGFFGVAIIRVLFPKVGVALGWTNAEIAIVVAMVLVGQAVAMLSTYANAWWRGKLWPQLLAQAAMLTCGIAIWHSSSQFVLGAAFFGVGLAQGIAYTAALFHGIECTPSRGRATGIHESLVSSGHLAGNLLGGFAAQFISLRAPYVLFACLAGIALLATLCLSATIRRNRAAA